MIQNKYDAFWLSYSSISDYLKCPRLYFLKNIYRDPQTERKISLITPPMALGQVIHEILEILSNLPKDKRFTISLLKRLDKSWQKISREKGGFESIAQEKIYFSRAENMMKQVIKNPGPIKKLAVKINDKLPSFFLSEKDNIVLCGKIDWLEYLAKTNSIHIIDFKTGRGRQLTDSLQLPIYHLLAHNCQERKVDKVSLWYLERQTKPTRKKLPKLKYAKELVLKIAKKIKLAKSLNKLDCPNKSEGCKYCLPYEKIAKGEGKLVSINEFGVNVYILQKEKANDASKSKIL